MPSAQIVPWHDVLGVQPDAALSVINAAYKALSRAGDVDQLTLNQAVEVGRKLRGAA